MVLLLRLYYYQKVHLLTNCHWEIFQHIKGLNYKEDVMSFWGMVGAILVALIIFAVVGWLQTFWKECVISWKKYLHHWWLLLCWFWADAEDMLPVTGIPISALFEGNQLHTTRPIMVIVTNTGKMQLKASKHN